MTTESLFICAGSVYRQRVGTLIYGADLVRLAAAVERGPEIPHRLGVLSAAAAARPVWREPGEWIADHARTRAPVIAAQPWLLVLREACRERLPVCAEREEALRALAATVRALSGEGATPNDMRRWADRATELDPGRLLAVLAQVVTAAEARCAEAGLMARSTVLRTPCELSVAPVGVLLADPGAVGSLTLMRGVRTHAAARLALLYQPDDQIEHAAGQRFLDAAARENYGVHEHELAPAEPLPAPPVGDSDLERAAAMLKVGGDVWTTRWFAALVGAAAASRSTRPVYDAALMAWAARPRDRTAALGWLRAQGALDLPAERALLMSPAELEPQRLPRALGRLYRERSAAPQRVSEFCAWLGVTAPVWAGQTDALGIVLTPSEWVQWLAEEVPHAHGEGPAVLNTPWVPAGVRPISYLDSPLAARRRSLLTPRLERFLARGGLGSLLVARPQVPPLVQRTSASAVAPPVPEPALAVVPPLTQVSVSGLIDYANCPHRFVLRHVLRSREPQQAHLGPMEMGSALHRTLEKALRPLLDQPLQAAPIATVVASVEPTLQAELMSMRRGMPLSARDTLAIEQWGARLQEHLQQDLHFLAVNEGRVAGLERAVEVEVGGLKVKGRIDRLDRIGDALWVRDYKMSRSPPQLGQPEAVQLYMYGAGLDWQIGGATFYSLYSGESVGASAEPRFAGKGVKSQSPVHALAPLKYTVDAAVAGIVAGDFAPQPLFGEETCANCHVRLMCRFRATGAEAENESARDD